MLKIPFYTVIGPFLRRNCHSLNVLCLSTGIKAGSWYLTLLAFAGIILGAYDIIQIVINGPVLSEKWRNNLPNGEGFISPTVQRDVQFFFLVVNFIVYLNLFIGVLIRHPVLLMGWLAQQALVIFLEMLIMIGYFICNGSLRVNKCNLTQAFFLIFNYYIVLCQFRNMLGDCDY